MSSIATISAVTVAVAAVASTAYTVMSSSSKSSGGGGGASYTPQQQPVKMPDLPTPVAAPVGRAGAREEDGGGRGGSARPGARRGRHHRDRRAGRHDRHDDQEEDLVGELIMSQYVESMLPSMGLTTDATGNIVPVPEPGAAQPRAARRAAAHTDARAGRGPGGPGQGDDDPGRHPRAAADRPVG